MYTYISRYMNIYISLSLFYFSFLFFFLREIGAGTNQIYFSLNDFSNLRLPPVIITLSRPRTRISTTCQPSPRGPSLKSSGRVVRIDFPTRSILRSTPHPLSSSSRFEFLSLPSSPFPRSDPVHLRLDARFDAPSVQLPLQQFTKLSSFPRRENLLEETCLLVFGRDSSSTPYNYTTFHKTILLDRWFDFENFAEDPLFEISPRNFIVDKSVSLGTNSFRGTLGNFLIFFVISKHIRC